MKKYVIIVSNLCLASGEALKSLEKEVNEKRKEKNSMLCLGGVQISTEKGYSIAYQAVEYEE